MATGATKWIWENSRASNGSLLVLLAIADEIGEGEFAEMSIAELTRKCRLSDRAVRMAVKDLEALGELAVEARRGGLSRYAPRQILPDHPGKICTPAKSAPRQNLPDPLEELQVKATPAKSAGREISDDLKGSVVSGKRSRSKDMSGTSRPDVDRICEHLADKIAERGSKRPLINHRWRTAARLMLDADGRTEQEIHGAIDWCQRHHFWHRNVMSMEKLRSQYDRLLLEAKAEREKAGMRKSRQPDDADYQTEMEIARELDRQEAMR